MGAEWSAATNIGSTVDNNSNRSLSENASASQSETIFTNFEFQRATETTTLTFAPSLRWQRFSDNSYGDVADRNLSGSFQWLQERGQLQLSATNSIESTLTAELSETGITNSNTYRRSNQESASWTRALSQQISVVVQASYSDVSYYGPNVAPLIVLTGYRYPTVSFAGQFGLTEQASLTATAFTDKILSRTPDNDSRESGLELGVNWSVSQTTHLAISIGASERSIRGVDSSAPVGALSLSRSTSTGSLQLAYSYGLVPYGSGFFVEQQQLSLSGSRSMTEFVSVDASLAGTDTNDSVSGGVGNRRRYVSVGAGLSWRPLQSWTLRGQLGFNQSRTTLALEDPLTASGWSSALTLTWSPQAQKHSS